MAIFKKLIKGDTVATSGTRAFRKLVRSLIPNGCTELAYLESTGNQWIDTGILPTKETNFELGVYYNTPVSATAAECCFGYRYTESPQWRMMITNYHDRVYSWTGGYVALGNNKRAQATEEGIHEYVFSYKDGIFSNGNNITQAIDISNDTIPTGSIQDSWTLHLFAGNWSTQNLFSGKIYYCKIWQDTKLVRDFVPILDSNGTPCMYDKVSGEMFYNAGSGEFSYEV